MSKIYHPPLPNISFTRPSSFFHICFPPSFITYTTIVYPSTFFTMHPRRLPFPPVPFTVIPNSIPTQKSS